MTKHVTDELSLLIFVLTVSDSRDYSLTFAGAIITDILNSSYAHPS